MSPKMGIGLSLRGKRGLKLRIWRIFAGSTSTFYPQAVDKTPELERICMDLRLFRTAIPDEYGSR